MFLVSIFGDTIISTRHFWWRIFASFGAVAAMLIAGYYMLPEQGLRGVATICVIGFGVEFLICIIGLFVLSKRQQRSPFSISQNMLDDKNSVEIIL